MFGGTKSLSKRIKHAENFKNLTELWGGGPEGMVEKTVAAQNSFTTLCTTLQTRPTLRETRQNSSTNLESETRLMEEVKF